MEWTIIGGGSDGEEAAVAVKRSGTVAVKRRLTRRDNATVACVKSHWLPVDAEMQSRV